MRKCEICGELFDEQFITQYERIEDKGNNYLKHNVIHVCIDCDHPEWDEETGDYYVIIDGVKWFN